MSIVDIRKGSELAKAFEQIAGSDPDGMLIVRHHVTRSNAKKIADFAIANQLPTMYRSEDFVELGGLMSYGLNYRKMYRRAATYVDKILKGAKPGSLAIEPPRHKFVINLKTAKKIGVQIPPEILLEANDVIQ